MTSVGRALLRTELILNEYVTVNDNQVYFFKLGKL